MKACLKCGEVVRGRGRKYCDSCRSHLCPGCGGRYSPENGNHKQVCCSLLCAAKIDPERTKRINRHRGIKPRTYHLRKRDKHGNALDREWRTAIFKRDNYTCRVCKVKGKRLEAHHIKPYSEYPRLRYVLSNGRTLCKDCHKRTKTFGWQKIWKHRREIAAKRLSQEVLNFAPEETK